MRLDARAEREDVVHGTECPQLWFLSTDLVKRYHIGVLLKKEIEIFYRFSEKETLHFVAKGGILLKDAAKA